ncbi:MAG: nuclear transport factor 2 family protein, partial [Gammaproteobacteria bacterium]|nr:nuclear transport factor 2 family protein [Gammaproteobacteria bacterium]
MAQSDPVAFTSRLKGWLDIQAIRTTLANHTRGIDRCDGDLLRSAYHDDAEVAYGFFDGPASDFCGILTDTPGGRTTMHRTSNMWIKLTGDDRAVSESYAFVYSETET